MQWVFWEGPRSRYRPLQYGLVAGALVGLLFLAIGIAGLFLDPNYAGAPEHIVGIPVLDAGAGILSAKVSRYGRPHLCKTVISDPTQQESVACE